MHTCAHPHPYTHTRSRTHTHNHAYPRTHTGVLAVKRSNGSTMTYRHLTCIVPPDPTLADIRRWISRHCGPGTTVAQLTAVVPEMRVNHLRDVDVYAHQRDLVIHEAVMRWSTLVSIGGSTIPAPSDKWVLPSNPSSMQRLWIRRLRPVLLCPTSYFPTPNTKTGHPAIPTVNTADNTP